MVAGATSEGLCLLEFKNRRALPAELLELPRLLSRPIIDGHPSDLPALAQTSRELAEYFDGTRTTFTIPLITPGTPFERSVWQALLTIPCGTTLSYGQVAQQLGNPDAQRAVGRANGRNRIAIIIPCHRVIDSNGHLHGYGGGLERKRWLLDHEAKMTGTSPTLWT